jgi:hypothetical protein
MNSLQKKVKITSGVVQSDNVTKTIYARGAR